MASFRSPFSSPDRTAKTLALIVVGCVLAAFCLVTASFDLARYGAFPHDRTALIDPVTARSSANHSAADDLAKAPLAALPLWEEAVRRDQRGDTARARRLMIEIVRRNPLFLEARGWLAVDAAKRGNYAEAVRQFDWLYVLSPAARPQIVTALATLARVPGGGPEIARLARRKPIWLTAVAGELIGSPAAPAVVFELLGGANARAGSDAIESSGLVASLVRRQQFDQAYLAWVTSLPETALSSVGYVYDGDFKKLPGAQPFNWTLVESDAATVDFGKRGGVEIAYFGDKPTQLLAQLLVLPPGRYRLDVRANNVVEPDGNQAGWSLYCGDDRARLIGRVDVPVAPGAVWRSIAFAVPQNCPAQTLSLDGASTEFVSAAAITLKAVRIRALGAGQ